MFIRKKSNKSGSVSIQIVSKKQGRYRVVESLGVGHNEQEIASLLLKAQALLRQVKGNLELFVDEEEAVFDSILSGLSNHQIQVVGPELIYGSLFDKIGYNQIKEKLFRHLVITRLYNPGSKLKTIDYLRDYLGVYKEIHEVYRFLDKLNDKLKRQVEDISYESVQTVGYRRQDEKQAVNDTIQIVSHPIDH
jgi:hypothetical protein